MSTPHHLSVAIDASPLYGPITGVGVAARELLHGLDADDRVTPVPYVLSGRATPQPGHRRLPVPGIVASHLWSRIDRPRADRWVGGVDLIHGTNYTAPPSRHPTLISVYDCWFLAHPELANPLVRRAGAQLRRAVRAGAHLHVSSEATAKMARELLSTDRVSVILLGPPEQDRCSEPPSPETVATLDGRPFAVAIGTEERRKGYPRLIAAFARAVDQGVDGHLVIAGGSGDDSEAMDAAIAAVPVDGRRRIHRLGRISDGTKAWLLDHARMLVYPSLDEGFGFPILEAQRAMVPIVATRVGSIPEVAGSGALLVDESLDEIATGIVDLWDDDRRRAELVAAGTANLGRFSWRHTTDAMIDLYGRVVEEAS